MSFTDYCLAGLAIICAGFLPAVCIFYVVVYAVRAIKDWLFEIRFVRLQRQCVETYMKNSQKPLNPRR